MLTLLGVRSLHWAPEHEWHDSQLSIPVGGEGGEARGHSLDHSESERLVERRLHEGAAAVGNEAVQLTVADAVLLSHQPPHLAVKPGFADEAVHLLALLLLLPADHIGVVRQIIAEGYARVYL